ncbi:MAG: hypothetical protein IJC63_06725 [Myxococcaceae bacterium]|nr:hypothetical protein [Myxococcaceae bacterium]
MAAPNSCPAAATGALKRHGHFFNRFNASGRVGHSSRPKRDSCRGPIDVHAVRLLVA